MIVILLVIIIVYIFFIREKIFRKIIVRPVKKVKIIKTPDVKTPGTGVFTSFTSFISLQPLVDFLKTDYEYSDAIKIFNQYRKKNVDRNKLKYLMEFIYDKHSTYIKRPVYIMKNDSQNVHDHILNMDMNEQYFDMIKHLGKATPLKLNFDDNHFTQLNCSEHVIYQNIWKRIHHKDNNANRNNLKTIFLNTISDRSVCMTGRVANAMGCLATIDPKYGIFKNTEFIKKEIFDKFNLLLQRDINNIIKKKGKYYDVAMSFRAKTSEELAKLDTSLEDEFMKIEYIKIKNAMKNEYKHISEFNKIYEELKSFNL